MVSSDFRNTPAYRAAHAAATANAVRPWTRAPEDDEDIPVFMRKIPQEPQEITPATHEFRARAIAQVVDHVNKNAVLHGGPESRPVNRIVIFSDGNRFPSALGARVRTALRGQVEVLVLDVAKFFNASISDTDVVITELANPTPQELDSAKAKLASYGRSASYRGIFAGPEQRSPEEIGIPYYRAPVPGQRETAKGVPSAVAPATPNPRGMGWQR